MTPAQLKNLGMYALAALVGALVTTGLHLAQILSGSDPVALRPLAATFTASFFGALATALGTSQLTRFGSEGLASQVNDLRAQGVSRSEMVVLSEADAASTLGRQNGRPFVRHGEGGHAALLATVPLRAGALLNVEDARHLDGRLIAPNETIRCDTCQAVLTHVVGGASGWVAESEAV